MDPTIEPRRVLLERAVHEWGKPSQVFMVMEEAGELLTALARWTRGRSTEAELITEIADLRIMLAQVEVMAGLDGDAVEAEVARKLARLSSRLQEYGQNRRSDTETAPDMAGTAADDSGAPGAQQ